MKAVKISVADICAKQPCYQPTEIKGITDTTAMTLLKWLNVRGYKNGYADKVWLFSRFADDVTNRKFALWCARRCKTTLPEINTYIDAIEGYYLLGTYTKEQMLSAYSAADSAADSVAYWEIRSAAGQAACNAAYRSACSAAYWSAARAADSAVDTTAERRAQVRKIKQLQSKG